MRGNVTRKSEREAAERFERMLGGVVPLAQVVEAEEWARAWLRSHPSERVMEEVADLLRAALADPAAPNVFLAPIVALKLHALAGCRSQIPDALREVAEVLYPPTTGKRKSFTALQEDAREEWRFGQVVSGLESLDVEAQAALKKIVGTGVFDKAREAARHERRSDLYILGAFLWYRGHGKHGEPPDVLAFRRTLSKVSVPGIVEALDAVKALHQRVKRKRRAK